MKIQRRESYCAALRGFSVVELLVVVGVLGVLIWVVIPSVYRVDVRSKGLQEAQNLRAIEAAKESFRAEQRGSLVVGSQLEEYFPMRRLPKSPWGLPYNGVTDLSAKVSSQANGLPQYEPDVEPLAANGFNDLALPGYVYLLSPPKQPLYIGVPMEVEGVPAQLLGPEEEGGDPLAPIP